MARKKNLPKPLFDLRFDFVESLENVCQQAIMLLQAVDTVKQHGNLPEAINAILEERADALRNALMSND